MAPAPDAPRTTGGPDAWIPAVIALGLLLALAISTAGDGFGGHTPILWFVLLTIVCAHLRRERWVTVLYLPAFVLFVSWFAGAAQWVTLPFAVGLLLAYLLDPIVDRLERKMKRVPAILLVSGPIVALVVLGSVLLVPAVIGEAGQLVSRLPELQQPLEALGRWAQQQAARVGFDLQPTTIGDFLLPRLEAIGRNLVGAGVGVWRGVQGVIGFVSFLVITPVIGFYLLRDFDRLREGALGQLPDATRTSVERYLHHVDRAVAGYLRGQLVVGAVVGTLFAIGLTVLGMDYAILVGMSALVLNLVPYVGAALTAALAVSVALLSDPSWMSLVKVGGLYGVISLLDSVISPRIMSESLSLHPVFVMVAVLVAGQFFGVVGVLIAVPAAAVLKEAFVVWTPQLMELLPLRGNRRAGA